MGRRNLHRIPRFDNSLGYLYIERAVIEREDHAVAAHNQEGTVPIPVASLSVLMLGPGTRITHEAIKAIADNNCLLVWCGEEGVRFYAAGMGGTRNTQALLRQAELASDTQSRLRVVRRMYLMRFSEKLDPSLTLQQVRGLEGIRVREAYKRASEKSGVPWKGRSYDPRNWGATDGVNRALSAGNACLYGLVHSAILSIGMSPALGFVHTGKQLSFVYDIADLYKASLVVPLAFEVVKESRQEVEKRMRHACRDLFHRERLLTRIIPDIRTVLDIEGEDPISQSEGGDTQPTPWWSPPTTGDRTRLDGSGQGPTNEDCDRSGET